MKATNLLSVWLFSISLISCSEYEPPKLKLVKKRENDPTLVGENYKHTEVTYFIYVYGSEYTEVEKAIRKYIDTATIDTSKHECIMIFYKADLMLDSSEIKMEGKEFNDYISFSPEDDFAWWSKAYGVYSSEPTQKKISESNEMKGSLYFCKHSPKHEQEINFVRKWK